MLKFKCPCCGFMTLPEPSPGSLEICHVCFWQDDMVGFNRPNLAIGSNVVSLDEARVNYRKLGACEHRFVMDVRLPRLDEYPDSSL